MTNKEILFGRDARQKIIEGINLTANAVKVTLGPCGRNVMIEKSFGSPKITKDGVTVAKEIDLSDAFQNMGAQAIKAVASKTNDVAGDGTTTSTVLAQAIVKEGEKAVTSGLNPMELKRGIDYATTAVLNYLETVSKKVENQSEIAQVATISANGDTNIGSKIAEAVEKVGPESPITVEEARGLDFEMEVVEGMNFDRGYLSPYFVTNHEKLRVEFDNALILMIDGKLNSVQPLIPLLEAVMKSGQPFLIIAEDIAGEALGSLVVNKVRAGLKIAAVKAPGFGDRRKAMLEDMAVLTGGQVISEEIGLKLENISIEHLGKVKKLTVSKDDTTIISDKASNTLLKDRCDQLKAEIKSTTSDYDREKLQERLAKLSDGVAILKVGGATEIEVKEKKDRVEDALAATRAAMKEGIVAGGGSALLYATPVLDEVISNLKETKSEDFKQGIKIIKQVLQAPISQIAENSGVNGAVVINDLLQVNKSNWGYDAKNGIVCDMLEKGIIDPTKVTRTALQDAASIAGLLVTTEAAIVSVKEEANQQPAPQNPMMGM